MKTIKELNKSKVPIVAIDPSLRKYRDKTPFPEKLAKANELLKNARFPKKKPTTKIGPGSNDGDK